MNFPEYKNLNDKYQVAILIDKPEPQLIAEAVKKLLNTFGWKDSSLLDLGDITAARATEATLPIWLSVYGAKQSGAFNFRIVS